MMSFPCASARLRLWSVAMLLASLLLWPGREVLATSWREVRSTHFIVLHQNDPAMAAAVRRQAEWLYDHLALHLGLTHVLRRDYVPWQWEKRCQIYLYPDRQSYLQETGAPPWSGGFVNYRQRRIYSFRGAATFLDTTLPHEITHLMFREYVGFDNPRVPRWLDEGVAQYMEEGTAERALERMQGWLEQGIMLPLDTLTGLRVNHAQGGAAQVFYTQAVTLVQFFLETYGQKRFLDLCSALRDGYPLERALSLATSGRLRALADLQAAWLAYVRDSP